MDRQRKAAYNSTYPKVAVQWYNQALCFYQSLCLVDSESLRNRHLRVAAKRCSEIPSGVSGKFVTTIINRNDKEKNNEHRNRNMEFLVTVLTLTLFVGLLISPIILLRFINRTNIKYKFVSYMTIGVFLTALITIVFAWWAYTSDLLLLKHYGYNIDGMNETEFYGKVLPENMDKVKSLETSIMGIGWPLKAILTFVFYSPYLLIIYGVTYLIGRKTRKAELQ